MMIIMKSTTKTETKAEQKLEGESLAVGSFGAGESYVSPRASILYSLVDFLSPL